MIVIVYCTKKYIHFLKYVTNYSYILAVFHVSASVRYLREMMAKYNLYQL